MAFSFIVLSPFALAMDMDVHIKTLQKQWKGILYIGAFMALNIALNNLSLLDISLSLNQIIRSAIPVVTCTLAIFVESKIPTGQEATALTMLTVGVMIAVWQNSVSGKISGVVLCIAATVCNGATMTFSSKLLSEKLDIVRLTFYTAPISLACLLPFYLIREHKEFVPALGQNHANILGILLLSSINAVCYNLIHALVIKHTSAVASTVLGEVKIVGLLLLSAVLLGESKEFSSHMLVGCVMALGGFFWYSHIKMVGRNQTKVPSLIVSISEKNGGT